MKILIDESLPQQMRLYFPNHNAITVGYMRWRGYKNGELLDAAEAADFHVILTADRGIPYQQNMRNRTIAIIVLAGQDNQEETLALLVPSVLNVLHTIEPGQVVRIGDA